MNRPVTLHIFPFFQASIEILGNLQGETVALITSHLHSCDHPKIKIALTAHGIICTVAIVIMNTGSLCHLIVVSSVVPVGSCGKFLLLRCQPAHHLNIDPVTVRPLLPGVFRCQHRSTCMFRCDLSGIIHHHNGRLRGSPADLCHGLPFQSDLSGVALTDLSGRKPKFFSSGILELDLYFLCLSRPNLQRFQ